MSNSKAKILIVDDSSTNNLLFQNVLEDEGFEIKVAIDGKEALDVIANYKPNLVLLDIMMPRMDGFEVLENLRNDNKLSSIPVVILTAKKDSLTMKKCLSLGAKEFLVKPVGVDEIVEKINRAIKT